MDASEKRIRRRALLHTYHVDVSQGGYEFKNDYCTNRTRSYKNESRTCIYSVYTIIYSNQNTNYSTALLRLVTCSNTINLIILCD